MTDLLGIGASGVRAIQGALNAVGDNVANADTKGYVRRTVRLATLGAGGTAPLQRLPVVGSGVGIAGVDRAGDALKTAAARFASGDAARLTTRADWLARLQTAVTAGNLDARLGWFFDAATGLAAAPTSTAARTVFLDRADQAATAFRDTGGALAGLGRDIATASDAIADEVNAIGSALGHVNEELRRTATDSSAANGLLDRRDTLLADLAERVRITVVAGPRGTVEVKLGSGAAAATVVPLRGTPTRIGVRDGAAGPEVVLDPTHHPVILRLPASGSLAGAIEAGRQVSAAAATVDALASRFGAAVNAQHRRGTDAVGAAGGDLFATATLTTTPGKANAGAAPVDVVVGDGAALAPGGYTLLRTGGDWTLSRADASATISGPGPLVLDGVTVTPGSGARDGDIWSLGVAGGAAGLALRPIGTEALAVADRWLTDAGAANSCGGSLTVTENAAAAGFAPLAAYRITVTGAGVAEVSDPATGAVLATIAADGNPVTGAGFDFSVPADAAVGDSFRIVVARAASSDNGNIRRLADVRSGAGPDGTLENALDAAIARIGSTLGETKRLAETAVAVRDDAAAAADAVSGVDLDREAAELTRLQTAYRANAQVMVAARALFDALLEAAR